MVAASSSARGACVGQRQLGPGGARVGQLQLGPVGGARTAAIVAASSSGRGARVGRLQLGPGGARVGQLQLGPGGARASASRRDGIGLPLTLEGDRPIPLGARATGHTEGIGVASAKRLGAPCILGAPLVAAVHRAR